MEIEAIKAFKKMFPSCEAFSDLYYKVLEDGKLQTCQLDALVKHDNNIFVIECATHPVTKSAKDGLIDPITHDIEQSVERTLRQAKRAKTFMTRQDIAEFTTSNKSKVTIKTKKVSNYFLVSITGDSFDPFVCDSSALSNMGFTSDNEIPWTVYIENLKLISDFVDMPSQFVHYLKQRGSLKQRIIASDEIDYFGCYLACNLDIPMPPGERIDTTLIVDASSDFNRYFEYQRGIRPRVPRPGQYLPKHFKSLLKTFERIHVPGYTDVCCLLLDMSFSRRRNLDKNIASSISRWKANQSKCKDFSFIDVENQYGFTYFCFSSKELCAMDPIEFLPEFCLTKMHEHGLTRWLGISNDQAFRSPVASCFFCGGQTKDKNERKRQFGSRTLDRENPE